MRFLLRAACLCLSLASAADAQPGKSDSKFTLPPGYVIELVVGPPLVEHPMMGHFDERGRLFIADSAGLNLKAADLLKELPNRVRVLEPANEKGHFTKGSIFADRMSFPQGALWHRGSLYTASPPSIWKLTDTKGTGKADTRTELVSKFGFIGNAADIHGPFLGPDGRLYWCDGRHGHDIQQPDGSTTKGKAARIFRSKIDGSEVEVVCGGGMDNPVEIAFTEEGEPFVTVDILHNLPARNDGIIFAIEGGAYPWHEVSREFVRTGDLLPAVENLGWVAPSGLMRYRGTALGKGFQNNLFSAQFNRNRIQRHIVERDGASFKMKTEDFLTCTDKNFHPTDVLEDADGSLLVIDTGGWFRIGCPTSKIAQPEIKGAIYRIRKMDAPKMEDPRGLKLNWEKATEADLAARLDDARPMVRDRAIDTLALREESALPALRRVILDKRSPEAIRNAVWALTRIQHPEARGLVRLALDSESLTIQLVAAHSAGLHRDKLATPKLEGLLTESHPALKRQAATALSRIKDAGSIGPLMQAVKDGGDRFLEHALIYALIRIEDSERLSPYLKQPNAKVQRAALIALDQMPSNPLKREQVVSLLHTDDAALRKAALDVIARRPGWGKDIVGLLRDWLGERELDAARGASLRDLVQGLSGDKEVQAVVTDALRDERTTLPIRLILLEAIAQAPIAKLPQTWIEYLSKVPFSTPDDRIAIQSIAILHQRGFKERDYEERLLRLTSLEDIFRPRVQIAALAALDGRYPISPRPFAMLMRRLDDKDDPLGRLKVVRLLSQSPLSSEQLAELVRKIPALGPLEIPHLLQPFATVKNEKVGAALLDALDKSPGTAGLSASEVRKTFASYSMPLRERAEKLAMKLDASLSDQKKKLDDLASLLEGGDVELGRNVFFGPKALCATCHGVQGRGGMIGPELSKIGAIRSGRDLLESVVFPSSSFARGYEPWSVETKAGTTVHGLLARETADAVIITTTDRQEIRLPRDQIETMQSARISIMPQGLDAQLSREELRHLFAFLQSLR